MDNTCSTKTIVNSSSTKPIEEKISKILCNERKFGLINSIFFLLHNVYNYKFNNINSIKLNTSYKKLLTTQNYPNNKNVYNNIFQNTVNGVQFFLGQNESFFDDKIRIINEKCKDSFIIDDLDNLNNIMYPNGLTFSYKKIYYILFWYLGITRNLINIIQNNDGSLLWLKCFFHFDCNKFINNYKYGVVSIFNTDINEHTHPLIMSRFNNYKIRFVYNCLKYLDNKKVLYKYYLIINTKINDEIIYTSTILKFENNIYYFDENFSITNIYGPNLDKRINTLKLIIEHFDNLQIAGKNINDKKRDIISIYYYIIILMPFALGTASIAEMFLYSIWKFYIGTRLEIRQSIMLDVEALSHTFDDFYKNCFNHDDNENNPTILRQIDGYNEETYIPVVYTPYLVETKKNNKSSNWGGLFSMD
jgi:hypothetical protein